MKKILKVNSILSGIFMATLSVLTGYMSIAQAVDNDPNLAIAPTAAAAASAPMQAAGPIQLKTPAAAASAPAAAGSAVAGSSVAPPVTSPIVVHAPKSEPTELSDAEFRSYSFAFKNIDGAGVNKLESPTVNDRWRKPLKIDGVEKYVSNDQKQFLDFYGPYDDGSTDVVTVNKLEGQATLTAFVAKQPVSYTVVNKRGEYTATPGFCKLLAFQTNSKDFTELSERAVTCKAFYDKTNFDDSMKAAIESTLQKHRDIHRRNLTMLRESTAKPMIDEITKHAASSNGGKNWAKDQSWIRGLASLVGKEVKPSADPLKTILPRNVLTAKGSPQEAEDRAVLFDLAEACGRLWKDSDATAAVGGKSKPAASAPVRK